MAESSGLSDVLRDMAEGSSSSRSGRSSRSASSPSPPPEKARSGKPSRPAGPTSDADSEEFVVAELDDESGSAPVASVRRVRSSGASSSGAGPVPSSRRRAPASPPPNYLLKEVGACLFTTLSLLMLLWAVWGTMILMGMDIWRHDQPGARQMAMVSQLFYLLAAVGLSYSVFLFRHVAQAKKADKLAADKRRR